MTGILEVIEVIFHDKVRRKEGICDSMMAKDPHIVK